jgi:autotransporter translocation and assembly factor TamB
MSGPGNVTLSGEANKLEAEISGSGDLQARSLRVGSATVRSRGPGSMELSTVTDTLDAELHSSGTLSAAITGKRLALRMSGPGDATVTGTVDVVSAQLSGSGSLEGRGLVAGRADVNVNGPGSAEVQVLQPGAQGGRQHASLLVIERGSMRHTSE